MQVDVCVRRTHDTSPAFSTPGVVANSEAHPVGMPEPIATKGVWEQDVTDGHRGAISAVPTGRDPIS